MDKKDRDFEEVVTVLGRMVSLLDAFEHKKCACMDADPDEDCPHAPAWREVLSKARRIVRGHREMKLLN